MKKFPPAPSPPCGSCHKPVSHRQAQKRTAGVVTDLGRGARAPVVAPCRLHIATCRRSVNTTQHNTVQYNTTQHNIVQHNTIQYNIVQHNTIQLNTIQFNTIQYNLIAKCQGYCTRNVWVCQVDSLAHSHQSSNDSYIITLTTTKIMMILVKFAIPFAYAH